MWPFIFITVNLLKICDYWQDDISKMFPSFIAVFPELDEFGHCLKQKNEIFQVDWAMNLFLSSSLMQCRLHFILITWFRSQMIHNQNKRITWTLITSRKNSHTKQAKANSKQQLAHSFSILSFPVNTSNESHLGETNSLQSTLDDLQIPLQPWSISF